MYLLQPYVSPFPRATVYLHSHCVASDNLPAGGNVHHPAGEESRILKDPVCREGAFAGGVRGLNDPEKPGPPGWGGCSGRPRLAASMLVGSTVETCPGMSWRSILYTGFTH